MRGQLGSAVDSLSELGTRMDRAEKRLDGLSEEVHLIMDKRLADAGNSSLVSLPAISLNGPVSGTPLGSMSRSSYALALMLGGDGQPLKDPKASKRSILVDPAVKREEDYWRCRRALRLRPIAESDPSEEVKKFMSVHLGLSDSFIDSVGSFEARRVPYGPAAKIKQEVIVTFHSTDVRDTVKGSARNLAGKGKEFGIRLELPNHLKSSTKA